MLRDDSGRPEINYSREENHFGYSNSQNYNIVKINFENFYFARFLSFLPLLITYYAGILQLEHYLKM